MLLPNKDFYLLTKKEIICPEDFKKEIAFLSNILNSAASMQVFCLVNEVIDINRYKIIKKPFLIEKIATEKRLKPFVFFFSKN
jgi:hypothetical protein